LIVILYFMLGFDFLELIAIEGFKELSSARFYLNYFYKLVIYV
jgi:hypothetical protein